MAERLWWESWDPSLAPYGVLIGLLLSGRIHPAEFEALYHATFLNDPAQHPDADFQLLDHLFAEADSYCADPGLRAASGGIDETELVRQANVAWQGLVSLRRSDGA